MENTDWDDSGFIEDILPTPEVTKQTRAKKRKWREIENVKEQQRLRRELEAFNEYHL